MNSIKLAMTAQTPSAFGMPISGHAFGMSATTAVCTDIRAARERAVAVVATKVATDEGLGLAESYFPGTSAWRPPTC